MKSQSLVKHTEGPWTIETPRAEIHHGSMDDLLIYANRPFAGGMGYQKIATAQIWNAEEENQANARLIAAAPELLQACKRLLAQIKEMHGYSQPGSFDDMEKQAEVSIAKAEGRQ